MVTGINHEDQGTFLQMGNTRAEILQNSDWADKREALTGTHLSDDNVRFAMEFPTTIKQLNQYKFEKLFRQGFEVANDTLSIYHEMDFKNITYHQQ